MFTADKWQEYELIDCDGGERLERWGNYILVRPDPQVIWKGERTNPLWRKAHGVYKRQGGGGSWTVHRMPESWCISYPSAVGELTSDSARWDSSTPGFSRNRRQTGIGRLVL